MESIQFMDLPDEILSMISTKLNTIDAFDSLTGIHERIDKILHDRGFTNRLKLFKWSSDDIIYPLYV
jgi:hypothetical protein